MFARTTVIGAAAAAAIGWAGLTAPASAAPAAAINLGDSAPAMTQTVQYRGGYYGYGGRDVWRSGQWRGNNWHGYRGRRGDRWVGPAAGFAAGAILGGALSGAFARAPYDDDAVAWCAQRYRSYDPATQTYVTNRGVRRSCP